MINEYIKQLKKYKNILTRQELLTLRGQILKKDFIAYEKGLKKILERRKKYD